MNLVRNTGSKLATDAVRQARIDLAAALRLAVRFGLDEGIYNHFTVMLPGAEDRFLLHPFGFGIEQLDKAEPRLAPSCRGDQGRGTGGPVRDGPPLDQRIETGDP